MARKELNGIDLVNTKVINSASASALTDVPNWGQVQNLVGGLDWKASVRAAATANVTLTAPGASLDGYTFAAGDTFLAPNQTTASANGVYVWNGASTTATLRSDFVQGEVSSGATVYVENGTVNGKRQYTLTTADPITVGTTSLTFTLTGAGFVYSAGTNITISPTGVIAATAPQKFSGNVGDGSSTSITVTHNLGTQDFIWGLYNASTGETVDTDGTSRTSTTLVLAFATAPAANAYRVVCIG